MDEMDFLWQSIIGDFYYNLNERDHEGRTALYILSLNPRSDLNLFTWHIRNQASISTPQVDGLTCLHGAILSLQPQQETSYVDLRRLLGRWVWNTSDRYDEKDRENQREKIELLICQGADVFAVSDQYGTPTDIARLTGNVSLWFDALRNSGLDPKATLAVDKKIPRHPRFQLTKQCARNLHRVRSLRWQRLQSIFSVIDDFDGEKGRSIDSAILEWDNLPNALNIVHIGTCSGIIDILGAALGSMISRYPLARIGEGLLVKCEHLECGEYRKVFNDSCYYDATVPLQCMMELTDLVHYLRVFAEIATGDCVLRAGEIDWKLHWRYVTILKAAAQLQLNCTSLLPLPAGMLKYPTFDDAEAMAIMPGSWPADQEPL